MRETWIRSLGRKDPLGKGMATHSSTLAWRIPMDGGAWRATVHGVAKTSERLSFHFHIPASRHSPGLRVEDKEF